MHDPHFLSATDLAAAVRERRISAEALLQHFLDRVERLDPAINAVVVRDFERARHDARAADRALERGDRPGPLHGVPMTVKESFDVAGQRTTRGLQRLQGNVAREDAVAVRRLRAAGAVILGKTNVPAALADFQTYNALYGTTGNPWDPQRTPGGSSGGSAAALAAGLTGLEVGSDIGGSIRNPAHYCGVFGHKPTFDLLPLRGHGLPGQVAGPDLTVIGPLARSARDLRTALDVLAGPDALDARGLRVALPEPEQPVTAWRVAVWADDPIAPVAACVRERVLAAAEALRRAGATVSETARPDVPARALHETYGFLLQAEMAARLPEGELAVLREQAAALDPADDTPTARTLRAQTTSLADWKRAHETRTRHRWAWEHFFGTWDVLLAPVMATSAFPHDQSPAQGRRRIVVDGESRPYLEQLFWAGLAVSAYLPATVVPTGPDEQGLPVGVQIIGPAWGDRLTLAVAEHLEGAGFGFRPPPGW